MTTTPKRRLHRLLTPIIVVLVVIIGTLAVHWISEPDSGDADYLSPQTAGDLSSVDIVERLRAKGITVQRETQATVALSALNAKRGQATLFVPAPELLHPDSLRELRKSPAGSRVVLVEPGDVQLGYALPALGVAGRRWATAAVSSGPCHLTDARRAAVLRTQYGEYYNSEASASYCFDHGLASTVFQKVEFVLVGSSDPFRADRLSEHDNAELAVDLLSARPTLIWLDTHASERRTPKPRTSTSKPPAAQAPPQAAGQDPPSPFPTWLFAAFAMLGLAGLALAWARGRRLGRPATEPLPIEVRGAETALGRSRLYQRAKARGAAIETLRYEARRRIAVALRLPVNVEREPLLDALTERLGDNRAQLADILYGPVPDGDDELQTRATELLLLVEQVTRGKKENPGD